VVWVNAALSDEGVYVCQSGPVFTYNDLKNLKESVMKKQSKPRIAFFDFTDCEGCQLQFANMGNTFLELTSLLI